jgi:hypothetical protein
MKSDDNTKAIRDGIMRHVPGANRVAAKRAEKTGAVVRAKKPVAAVPATPASTALVAPVGDRANLKPMRISDGVLMAARGLKRSRGGRPAGLTAEQVFTPYQPAPGVVPASAIAKAKKNTNIGLAMDEAMGGQLGDMLNNWGFEGVGGSSFAEGIGFLGYPYLAELTQRPEFRRISERIATEATRKWIKLQATGEGKDKKLKRIEDAMKVLQVKERFFSAAQHDGWFGKAHIYLDTGVTDDHVELQTSIGNGRDEVSRAKVGKGRGLERLTSVEPMWVYPASYNAINPLKPSWYLPKTWFANGIEIHRTRLLTFVGRELPDILKPAYAFGGLSMSQMAKPYVDNWLRTRQAVCDVIECFSVSGVYTNMAATLQEGGVEAIKRIAMFNDMRSNAGVFALDKDTEEFFNVATPLGTLDKLQAQAQEQMSSVSGIPLIVLLGITPSGLNASSEGEIRVFYDYIHAFQESFFRDNLQAVIDLIQLTIFGKVDPEITFIFEPLWAMTEKEVAEIDKIEAESDQIRIDSGVLDPLEVRTALAADANSRYPDIDVNDVPELPEPEGGAGGEGDEGGEPGAEGGEGNDQTGGFGPRKEAGAQDGDLPFAHDAGFEESDHPRADDGKFGSGGGSGSAAPGKAKGSPKAGELTNHPAEKMRDYTAKELDWEYEVEYLKYSKGAFPDAFTSREDFQTKLDAAPLVYLDQKQMRELGNSMAASGTSKGEQWVHDTFSHRRDSKRIIDEMKNGKTSAPIILKSGNKLRLMAGQTRLATGQALGIQVPAKVIDVTPKNGAQDEATWDESKHPRATDGKFGSGGSSSGAKKTAGPVKSEKHGVFATKKHLVAHMLTQGTTTKEILQETGWPSVTVPGQAAALGLKLEKTKKDGETFYKGKPMTEAEKADLKLMAQATKNGKADAETLKALEAIVNKPASNMTEAIAKAVLKANPGMAKVVEKSKSPKNAALDKLEENTKGFSTEAMKNPNTMAKEKVKAAVQSGGDVAVAKSMMTPAELAAVAEDYHKTVEKMFESSLNHFDKAKGESEALTKYKAQQEKDKAENAAKLKKMNADPAFSALAGVTGVGEATELLKRGKIAKDLLAKHGIDITETDGALLTSYIGSYYAKVNIQAYEGAISPEQFKYRQALTAAMEKMPKYEGKVIRGIKNITDATFAKYKANHIVPSVALMSAGKKDKLWGEHTLEIESKSARDISLLNPQEGGGEVVFMPHTAFHVVSNNGKHAVLKEV